MKVWTQHQQECLQAMGITQWQSKFEEVAPNKVPSVDPLVVTDMLKSIASTEQGVDATEGILELTETTWETLQSDVSACQLCALHQTRQQAILGKGNQQAKLLIIGNAPTDNDDNQNQSFAGDGGVLLTKMLQAINIMQNKISQFKLASYSPDVIIDIPKDYCGIFDFHKAKEVVEIGRIITKNVLKKIEFSKNILSNGNGSKNVK